MVIEERVSSVSVCPRPPTFKVRMLETSFDAMFWNQQALNENQKMSSSRARALVMARVLHIRVLQKPSVTLLVISDVVVVSNPLQFATPSPH